MTTIATAAAAAKPKRGWRGIVWARLAVYGIGLPLFIVAGWVSYWRITQMPPLEDDLSVLIPRDGVLAYAEVASVRDMVAAARRTSYFEQLILQDAAGKSIKPISLPDEEQDDIDDEYKRARGARWLIPLLERLGGQGAAIAMLRPDPEKPAMVLLLTRSGPATIGTVTSALSVIMFGTKKIVTRHRDVDITAYESEDNPEESMMLAQMGDLFIMISGTADANQLKPLVDRWYAPDHKTSYFATVKRAREKLGTSDTRPGEKLWMMVTGDGATMAGSLLDRGRARVDKEPKDAAELIDQAIFNERLGRFTMVARSLANPETGQPARFEIVTLSERDHDFPHDIIAPSTEPWAENESIRVVAGNGRAARTALAAFLPRIEIDRKDREGLRKRISTMFAEPDSECDDGPLTLHLSVRREPEWHVTGALKSDPAGDSVRCLQTFLARRPYVGLEEWLLPGTKDGRQHIWFSPSALPPPDFGGDAAIPKLPARPDPDLLLHVEARFADLTDEQFAAMAEAFTRDWAKRPGDRRSVIRIWYHLRQAKTFTLKMRAEGPRLIRTESVWQW